ncbi:peptide chain release factor-like protein [Candidatus Vidania fulgoroideorum]
MKEEIELIRLLEERKRIKLKRKYRRNIYIDIIEDINKKKLVRMIKKVIEIGEKIETIYIEVREGLGGMESELFCKEVYNMYRKFLERKKALIEIISLKETNRGIKRIIIRAKGKRLLKYLRNENGVHRIQRVPKTEKRGRVHTSTCIVEIYEEGKVTKNKVNRRELRIETFKSRGPGGQSVNKTNSAVRITHIPSGISVECQKERSQMENKRYAMILLKAKIEKLEREKEDIRIKERREEKLGDYSIRSSKVKTYNLIKKSIINHINGKRTNKVKQILMDGKIEVIS